MSEKTGRIDSLTIEEKERRAGSIQAFTILIMVHDKIGPLLNNTTGDQVYRLAMNTVNNIIDLEDKNTESRKMNNTGIGIVYYEFSEEEAQEGSRILEWILGINSNLKSYFFRNYHNTPIFGALFQVHKLFTTERIYIEGSEGSGKVIRIDVFSIKIFLLALEETIDYLEDEGNNRNNLNPYEGYLHIMREYNKFLEESETFS